ncbi:protein toll [Parasteatoda tepidariorum]|uniref:protein toll n=1 Tax=Parasteatoda tepidariorum TaxID=114398 RepID=UPI001C71AC69|nr:protein toll [Parasteatoda tepidariorum]
MNVYGINVFLSLFTLALGINFDEDNDIASKNCSELLPGCDCYDLETIGIIQVKCWNATELFNTSYLMDGSIFGVNETYEIIVEGGVSALPPRSLEGLIVYRLILDDPGILDIHEDAFENVLRLRRFHVRGSSLKKIPNLGPVRDSLQYLNLDNSLLTSLEGHALKNFSFLENISFFNNSIQQIDSDVFEGTNNVIIFDLSYNKLAYLPSHLFDSWKSLRKVALSHNQLLHVKNLFQFATPLFIYLDYNNLTDINAILPSKNLNLTTLLISNNPITKVTPTCFNDKAPNIKFIYMDHCLIRKFDVSHYQNLAHLNTLDLSYNMLEEMPEQSINFGFNLELVLVGNQIREFHAEMGYNVKRLYLTSNNLKKLGKTLRFTQLTEVSIDKNELQQLAVEDFVGVNELNVFKVQENKIARIDREAFDTIRNDLNNVDLSCNLLKSLNGSIRFLSQLKYLNLTSNLIEKFEDREFAGLNELSELYIRGNRIVELGDQLESLPQLQFLVLSSNRIQSLKMEQIPKSLQYLYLRDNPMQCDCRLLPFLQWLNSSGSPITDYPLCLSTASNSSKRVQSCPTGCNCYCTKDADNYFMTLDCSFKNMSVLPQLLTVNSVDDSFHLKINFEMQFYEENSTVENSIAVIDTVRGINLSNNNLESLENARWPSDLRQLFLHNNKLRKMTNVILLDFPVLRKVSLSGNPWICDCDTVEFRRCILSKEEIILDGNQTLCGKSDESGNNALEGKAIWTLDDRDLCPTFIGLYFSIGFGLIAFSLVITVLKIVHTRYEKDIKVWLYSHGIKWVKEKDIDKDKKYDAFISYSDKDFDAVQNLIRTIEAKQPMSRLHFHFRDFLGGAPIEQNIIHAVQNSKRTIVVLSKNYQESEWCIFEFQRARSQTLKDKVNRILIIRMGELPDNLDDNIKAHLKSTTYLIWGEKFFWEKLFYALPTSGQKNDKISSSDFNSKSCLVGI